MSASPTVEEVRNVFTTLEAGGGRSTGVRETRVTVAAGPVVQSVDVDRGPALLIPVVRLEEAVMETPAAGLALSRRTLVDGSVAIAYQVVRCTDERLAGTFVYFCTELLAALHERPVDPPAQTCRRLIDQWRDLLVKVPSQWLSPTALAGLVAELHLLEAVATAHGPDRALTTWAAASGGRHDFRSEERAVEVKATTNHNRVKVSIHGLSQLEAPVDGLLYLYAERLESVGEAGDTVPVLIDRLDELGVPHRGLLERLAARGYVDDRDHYRRAGFEVLDTRSALVNDQFPALTAHALVDATVGQRIEDVQYSIDMTDESSFAASAVRFVDLVAALGPTS